MKNFKKIIYSFLIVSIFILPVSSFAQTYNPYSSDPFSTGSTQVAPAPDLPLVTVDPNQTVDMPITTSQITNTPLPITSACTLPANIKIGDLLDFVTCNISRSVVPLIFVLALAAFVWGVVQYVILGAEEEAKRAKGRQFMIWGIVALAVMVSVWGLVRVLTNTFGVKNVIPQLQTR